MATPLAHSSPTPPEMKFKQIYRGICLHNRYEIRQLLGQGAFAEIWEAYDFLDRIPVALKLLLPDKDAKKPINELVDDFKSEAALHKQISARVQKVPKYYDYHRDEKFGPYLVMGVLGADIAAIVNANGHPMRKMSISCVGRIGRAAVSSLLDLHNNGFIHRDLKPQNLLLGPIGSLEQLDIYFADFGFAKKHIDLRTKKVVPAEHRPNFRGTAPYSSLRSQRFEDQGRRDDLEALCFLFVELLLGGLPWGRVLHPNIDRRERDTIICSMKETFISKAKELHSKGITSFNKKFDSAYCGPYDKKIYDMPPEDAARLLPPQIIRFLIEVHGLDYASIPNYDLLLSLLAEMEDDHVDECNKRYKTSYSEDSYSIELLEPIAKLQGASPRMKDCMDFFVNGVCFERTCQLQHVRTAAPDEVLNMFRGKRNRDHDGLGDEKAGPPKLVRRVVRSMRRNALVEI